MYSFLLKRKYLQIQGPASKSCMSMKLIIHIWLQLWPLIKKNLRLLILAVVLIIILFVWPVHLVRIQSLSFLSSFFLINPGQCPEAQFNLVFYWWKKYLVAVFIQISAGPSTSVNIWHNTGLLYLNLNISRKNIYF